MSKMMTLVTLLLKMPTMLAGRIFFLLEADFFKRLFFYKFIFQFRGNVDIPSLIYGIQRPKIDVYLARRIS